MKKEIYLCLFTQEKTHMSVFPPELMFWICLLPSAFHLTNRGTLFIRVLITALKGPQCL